MRKVLLASAAFAFFGAGSALATAPLVGEVEINAALAPACDLVSSDASVNVGPGTGSSIGNFTTTCNFSAQSLTVSFTSENGGVLNEDEPSLAAVDYKVVYEGISADASDIPAATPLSVTHPSGGLPGSNISRTFSVALLSALTVAGDYNDTLTISVAP